MKSDDKNKPSKHIIYLDANNLYGWEMTDYHYLPNCVTQDKMEKIDVNTIRKYNTDGCILEVDLKCPEELHDLHNDYNLAPKKIVIKENMLSDYCKKRYKKV